MKSKVAIVPKWESPAKKKERFEIRRLEWQLKRGIADRRERERMEAVLEEKRNNLENL